MVVCILFYLGFSTFTSSCPSVQKNSITFEKVKNKSLSLEVQLLTKINFNKLLNFFLEDNATYSFSLEQQNIPIKHFNSPIELKAYEHHHPDIYQKSTIHICRKRNGEKEFAAITFHENDIYFNSAIKDNFYPLNVELRVLNPFFQKKSLNFEQLDYFDAELQNQFHISNYRVEELLAILDKGSLFGGLTAIIDSVSLLSKNENKEMTFCQTNLSGLKSNLRVACEASEGQNNSTWYLNLKTKNQKTYTSIFSIGRKSKIQLIDPNILLSSFNCSMNNLLMEEFNYSQDFYHLKWGDIALDIKKNKNGIYKASSRIPVSTWKKSISSNPELSMSETKRNFEEFSLQVKLENRKDSISSGIDLGRILSSQHDNTTYLNLKDSLIELKTPLIGSKIYLSDFEYFTDVGTPIEVELEIIDDKHFVKEKKYQFYWKHIDTTIVLDESSNCYQTELSLEKNQFLECLKDEPILTSSKEGVLKEFKFSIYKATNAKEDFLKDIICSIKDPDVYSNLQLEKSLNAEIQIGDLVILSAFSSLGIPTSDDILLKIRIKEDSKIFPSSEDLLFVDWGEVKLKATDLREYKTKKFYSDQTVSKEKLLQICEEKMFIHNGKIKENIIAADLMISSKKRKFTCTKNEKWQYCLAEAFGFANTGDHINLFLRSSSGTSALLQLYIDENNQQEDILGYGNSSDFDSLLFNYAKPVVTTSLIDLTGFNLNWGKNLNLPLNLIGNPNVYRASTQIEIQKFQNLLGNEITLGSSDKSISLQEANLILYNGTSRPYLYVLDCHRGVCSLPEQDVYQVMEHLNAGVTMARILINKHSKELTQAKVSGIDFIFKDHVGPWRPMHLMNKHLKTDEVYEFQFVYNQRGKSILKIDKYNEKYKWMLDKYKDDPNVQILDMPNFKTIERTISASDDLVPMREIKRVELLSENYSDIHSFADFYDFGERRTDLLWKSYMGKRNTETYCLEDFICSEGDLILSVGDKRLEIVRGEMIIVTENEDIIKYIFDDINDFEIEKRLKSIKHHSSIYINNMLVKDEDEVILRFPLSFAFHLE